MCCHILVRTAATGPDSLTRGPTNPASPAEMSGRTGRINGNGSNQVGGYDQPPTQSTFKKDAWCKEGSVSELVVELKARVPLAARG